MPGPTGKRGWGTGISHHFASVKVKFRSCKNHLLTLNYGEQRICIVLKCLPKDYILIAREEEKQYTKRNPYRVIKINIVSEGQMGIMCYQM